MVGAAGFEPTITGSKPDALPLGYAPKRHHMSDVSGLIIGSYQHGNALNKKMSERLHI